MVHQYIKVEFNCGSCNNDTNNIILNIDTEEYADKLSGLIQNNLISQHKKCKKTIKSLTLRKEDAKLKSIRNLQNIVQMIYQCNHCKQSTFSILISNDNKTNHILLDKSTEQLICTNCNNNASFVAPIINKWKKPKTCKIL